MPVEHLQISTDEFNRANNTDLGAGWTETAGETPAISSNQVSTARSSSSDGAGIAINNGPGVTADQYAELVFKSGEAGLAGGRTGIGVRIAGTAGSVSGYWVGYLFNSNLILYRLSSGDLAATFGTQLGSTYTRTLVADDVLRIEVAGASVSVKLNGAVVIGPVTDSAIATGNPGILCAIRTEVSNLSNSWDSWKVGNIRWMGRSNRIRTADTMRRWRRTG